MDYGFRMARSPWLRSLPPKPKSACSAPPATPARSWCGCCCAIPTSSLRCSPPTAAPGRRCARCFRSSRRSSCRSSSRSKARLEEGRARSRLLRAAACDDAEGDQRSAGQGAEDQGGRSLGRLPAARRRGLCEVVRPRASCAGATAARRSMAWSRSIAPTIKKARLVANPGCYTTCAQLAAHAAAQGQGDRSGRDRDRCQVRHDRGGQGGEGGDAVLRSVRRLPRLWRRPSPPHGRARPGILDRRRPRGGGELHAASGADEPRHPLDHLRAGNPRHNGRGSSRDTFKVLREGAVRACAAVRRRRRRPAMCAART